MKCSLYRGSRVLLGALLALAVVGCDVSSKREKQEAPALNLTNEIKQADARVGWVKSRGKENDLKRDEAFKALKGKYVVFSGKVRKVGKTAVLGEPYVSLTDGKRNAFSDINIQFNVAGELVKTVTGWKEGDVHVLRGRVSAKALGGDAVECDNCEIVPEDKYKAVRETIPEPSESEETDEQMNEMKDRFEKKMKGALNGVGESMKNLKAEDVEKKLNEGMESIKNINTDDLKKGADDLKKGLEDAGNMMKSLSF